MEPFETIVRRGGSAAIQEASRFFMQADPVFETLRGITTRLKELGIPYAVLGGMALVAHGYRRTTEDVDILVSPDSLESIQRSLVGLGYRPLFEGSKNLRDTRTGVRIEFVLAGQFPGDGKPKPVAFPDPAKGAVEIDGIQYVGLPVLIELKLASGMTNPGRVHDLGDVQELIRVLNLSDDFANQLHTFVQSEFLKLASGVRGSYELLEP
ncbi:MAG: nucleotidyltransferase family protein [Phycisphaerales bacterium]|nr:nucleotidyltransferase family protein [Phycisphaerales bacterium]